MAQITGATLKDNSKEIMKLEQRTIEAALIKIGIAAKRNIQAVILEKDVYDTGELYRTVGYKPHPEKQNVDIGSPKEYAPFQELGTRNISARPFIKPGILDNIPEYEEIVAKTIKDAMNK